MAAKDYYTLIYFSGLDECINCDFYDNGMGTDTETTLFQDATIGTIADTSKRVDTGVVVTNWTVNVLLLIVFAIGMIGNLLLIFVIVILGEYKKVITHWYVLQLAIADTIFLLTIPLRIAEDIGGGATLPQWACQARETMFFLNYYASISFLVLMTVDRYIAICRRYSTKINKFRKRSVIYFNTAVVWIASLIICVPVMLYSTKVGFAPNCKCEFYASVPVTADDICAESGLTAVSNPSLYECLIEFDKHHSRQCWDDKEIMGIDMTAKVLHSKCNYKDRSDTFTALLFFNIIVMFFVPLGIMIVCYTLIALELKKTKLQQPTYNTPNNDSDAQSPLERRRPPSVATMRDNRNRNRATSMCFCLVVLFLLCWSPMHAVHIAKFRGINQEEDYCQHLFNIAFIVAYFSVSSHSILNPCMYNFMGKKSENRLINATSSVRIMIRSRSRSSCESSHKQSNSSSGKSEDRSN